MALPSYNTGNCIDKHCGTWGCEDREHRSDTTESEKVTLSCYTQ